MNYTSGAPRIANPTVCPAPKSSYDVEELLALYKDGVASDALLPEPGTGRINVAALQAHVNALTAAGIIKARPSQQVGTDTETVMRNLVNNDLLMYGNLQKEYCYYEQRYKYAFKEFLKLATSRNPTDNRKAQVMIENAKRLNVRLNSVLEVMNYLAAARVPIVDANKNDINIRNAAINEKLARARSGYEILNRDNAIILAQKEMVRYTEEKNNYNTHQIAAWAAANIIALGVIFYVYRS
jgi:hypothetical protein